ncbi:hypothetical protein [Marimonas lutisalis]|uniref:hypothetical protein n=1 Tax=Marimonas lutisalis TaxID=2545756 RepID=UPI0010F7D002|nr:hypothetical protein [Marimonas lutisalis]
MRTTALFIFLCLLSAPLQANPAAYTCTVLDMLTFDRKDTAFQAKNLRKEFDLLIDARTVTMLTRSKDFEDSTQTLAITANGPADIIADKLNRGAPTGTRLMLPRRHAALADKGSSFKATFVVQYSLFANSWLLTCARPSNS